MHLALPFRLEHEDEETAAYEEEVQSGNLPVIGTIAVKKSALATPPPILMSIILSYDVARPAPTEPSRATLSPELLSSERALEVGDAVVIVKNRLATLAAPPEWLGQYLGKTGTVLWTTDMGAMLDIDGSATWFSYAELERVDSEDR